MNIQYLSYFYAVAKHGGFSKAAGKLRIQQPSVSRAVNLLEQQLGVRLFERNQRSVVLTKAGQRVFELCKKAFDQIDAIEQLVQEEVHGPRGELRMGFSDHVLSYLVCPMMTQFQRTFTSIVPRTFTGTSEDICKRVAVDDLELAVLFTVPPEPSLRIRVLKEFPSRVVIARGLEKERKIRTHFIGSREIDYAASKSFPTLSMLKTYFPETDIRTSSNSLEAHKRFVLEGLGVAILPEFMIQTELTTMQLSILHPDYVFSAKLRLVIKRNRALSVAAKSFVKAFEKHLQMIEAKTNLTQP